MSGRVGFLLPFLHAVHCNNGPKISLLRCFASGHNRGYFAYRMWTRASRLAVVAWISLQNLQNLLSFSFWQDNSWPLFVFDEFLYFFPAVLPYLETFYWLILVLDFAFCRAQTVYFIAGNVFWIWVMEFVQFKREFRCWKYLMNLSNVICPVQARISLLEIFDGYK